MKSLSRVLLWVSAALFFGMAAMGAAYRPETDLVDPNAPYCGIFDPPQYGIADVRIPILVYHNVNPHEAGESADRRTYTVDPDSLDDQLTYLDDHGFTTVTMDEVADALSGIKALPRKPVALTFDDGKDTQYTYAMPVLARHAAVATFYVFTNAIGREGYLSWDQLREMIGYGSVVGSHSVYHPRLYKQTSREELESEIAGSKMTIEENLGVKVRNFAYPFGPAGDLAKTVLEENGYQTARTLSRTPVTSSSDRYLLPAAIATDDMTLFRSFVGE